MRIAPTGDYRVIYRFDYHLHAVTIMVIEHRSDTYRPRRR
jgi:mRNA-degrading endonuclease RelE of RelBE toxin-antitoxin system